MKTRRVLKGSQSSEYDPVSVLRYICGKQKTATPPKKVREIPVSTCVTRVLNPWSFTGGPRARIYLIPLQLCTVLLIYRSAVLFLVADFDVRPR